MAIWGWGSVGFRQESAYPLHPLTLAVEKREAHPGPRVAAFRSSDGDQVRHVPSRLVARNLAAGHSVIQKAQAIRRAQFFDSLGFRLKPSVVGPLERGVHNVSLDAICRLAHALKVRPGKLLQTLP